MRPGRGNAILITVAVGVVALIGLAVHGAVGGILLLVVATTLVLFSAGAWGHVRNEGKPLRLLVIAAVIAVAVLKLLGQL